MAYTVAQLRNERNTSIHGRRLALDRRDFIVGAPGVRQAVEDFGTSVPSTASLAAVTRCTTMSSTQGPVQHNLPAPVPGVTKRIIFASSSTASIQFLSTPNGASIIGASLGTTVGVVNFVGPGGSITLYGVSTAQWIVEQKTPAVTHTTST